MIATCTPQGDSSLIELVLPYAVVLNHLNPNKNSVPYILELINQQRTSKSTNQSLKRSNTNDVQHEWSTAGGNSYRNGICSRKFEPPLKLVWKFDEGKRPYGGIVVSDSIAVFGTKRGSSVFAIDIRNTQKLWEYQLEGSVYVGTPAIDHGHVFLKDSKNAICLDLKTGKQVWHTGINSIPEAVADNANEKKVEIRERSLYSMIGCILCLNEFVIYCDEQIVILYAENGRLVKRLYHNLEPCAHTGVCADDHYIYFPLHKEIQAFPLNSFKELLSASSQPDGMMNSKKTIYTNGRISAGPVLTDDILLYGSSRSTLEAVNTRKMSSLWSFHVEDPLLYPNSGAAVESRPIFSKGKVFFGGPDGNIYALEARNGKRIWKYKTTVLLNNPPLICDDIVFMQSGSLFLALSAENGQLLWQYGELDVHSVESLCAPAVADSLILVGMDHLYAFSEL